MLFSRSTPKVATGHDLAEELDLTLDYHEVTAAERGTHVEGRLVELEAELAALRKVQRRIKVAKEVI